MHLFPQINGTLDFICIGQVELSGARNKQTKISKCKKMLVHIEIRTHALPGRSNLPVHRLIHVASNTIDVNE